MVDHSRVRQSFLDRFGGKPRLFRAPGRVNLIGEHTDYNDGFVMPVAIDRDTVVATAPRKDNILRVYSENIQKEAAIDLDAPTTSEIGSWTSYVEGVARVLMSMGCDIQGADLVILSDVPEGAGLSSSAALELSVGTALAALNNIEIEPKDLALASQRAEHEYAGTQCGIMDQYISAAGQVDHALLIDCRAMTYIPVSIRSESTTWVVIDTKVKHSLATSAYNERRKECEQAVEHLKRFYPDITHLRDVAMDMLEAHESDLPEVIYRRARHVISENARTLVAKDALGAGDLKEVGQLMFASHASLKNDYEVTCPELDLLVESAIQFEGCLGSRMTGGGFGGCTISLVEKGRESEFIETLSKAYAKQFGFAPAPLMIQSAQGAHEITTSGAR
jgi:galactokinase